MFFLCLSPCGLCTSTDEGETANDSNPLKYLSSRIIFSQLHVASYGCKPAARIIQKRLQIDASRQVISLWIKSHCLAGKKMQRKDEILAKKAKLAELRRQREERQKEFARRDSASITPDVKPPFSVAVTDTRVNISPL